MTPPDERLRAREQLFAELLAGDRSLADPEVQDAMRDEDCRRQWDELHGVQARLDRTGERERAALAAVASGPSSGADPLVAQTIARLAGAPVPGAPTRSAATRRWVTIVVVAAAASLFAWLWIWSSLGDRRDDDRQMGQQPLELLGSVANADGGLELRWTSNLPDATFSVVVYDPEDPDAAPVARREQSAEKAWTLDGTLVQGLRPGLRWRVVAHVQGRTVERDALLR